MLKKLLLTSSLVLLTASASSANADDRSLVFTGFNLMKDSNYYYVGGVTSPFSSIHDDGFLLRASAARGSTEYQTTPGTDINSDVRSVDAMVGYQFRDLSVFNRITAYAGVDHQNHTLDAIDLANDVQGFETGFKGILEAVVDLDNNLNLDLAGNYSTVFDTYWTQGRLGYGCDCSGVKFGPEVLGLGSEAFDQQRYGAFVSGIPLGDMVKASLSSGFASSSSRGEDGLYFQAGFSLMF